jgi:hypothetical protein
MVAQGQVRMADTQMAISAAQANQKAMQVEVAEGAAPDRIVSEAEALGLGPPHNFYDLPYVPLDIPLPAPNTTPTTAR